MIAMMQNTFFLICTIFLPELTGNYYNLLYKPEKDIYVYIERQRERGRERELCPEIDTHQRISY